MSDLVRFGISIDQKLSERFDAYIHQQKYKNRSEAVRDLIRNAFVDEQWGKNEIVAGGISIVYDHHKRSLLNKLMTIQHDYHELIISTQHVHLDHANCLELIVVKGNASLISELYNKLKSIKGVAHVDITRSTVGVR